MLKNVRDFVIGAIVSGAIGSAVAVIGTPPGTGPQLVDGTWLNSLAAGQNETYQYGITATGSSSQATAFQLASGFAIVQVDTVASNAGVAAPECVAGTEFLLYNNGANTLTVYPAISNNLLTGAQDTINNTTSTTVTSHNSLQFGCAKNGVWFAK
jgi:gas vesicle protein